MPVIDMRAIEYTAQQMRAGILVLIGDTHNRSLARLVVQALLRYRAVRALFLELPSNSKAGSGSASAPIGQEYGVFLSEAAPAMVEKRLDEATAKSLMSKAGYFTTKFDGKFMGVGEGAKPDLLDLSSTAIAVGACVVPCDTDPTAVVSDLKRLPRPEGETVSGSTLFTDEGLGYRDNKTAQNVRFFINRSGIDTGLLMLWGANHIYGNEARVGLKERLQKYGILKIQSHMNPTAFFSDVR
jgi:hypothetical protein